MTSNRQRRWTFAALFLATLLLLVLWRWLRPAAESPAAVVPVKTEGSLSLAELPPDSAPAPVASAPVPEEDPSEVPYRTLQNAYKKLVSARSYRSTMTFLNPDGSVASTGTLEYWRDDAGQTHLRSESIFYDPRTDQPDPTRTRVVVVNPEGTWELNPGGNLSDVAFQVNDGSARTGYIELHRSYLEESSRILGPEGNLSYYQAETVANGRPVTVVSSTTTVSPDPAVDHLIDTQTGDLLEMRSHAPGWSVQFETDVELSPDRFAVPAGSVVVPSTDAGEDAAALSKMLKGSPPQPP